MNSSIFKMQGRTIFKVGSNCFLAPDPALIPYITECLEDKEFDKELIVKEEGQAILKLTKGPASQLLSVKLLNLV